MECAQQLDCLSGLPLHDDDHCLLAFHLHCRTAPTATDQTFLLLLLLLLLILVNVLPANAVSVRG